MLIALIVALFTSRGEIDISVDQTHAPKTAANFLAYARGGAFTHGAFFRTVLTQPDNQPQSRVFRHRQTRVASSPARAAGASKIANERTRRKRVIRLSRAAVEFRNESTIELMMRAYPRLHHGRSQNGP